MWASCAALVVGAAWWAKAWLGPLAQPEEAAPAPIGFVAMPRRVQAPIDERRDVLDALWARNRFAVVARG